MIFIWSVHYGALHVTARNDIWYKVHNNTNCNAISFSRILPEILIIYLLQHLHTSHVERGRKRHLKSCFPLIFYKFKKPNAICIIFSWVSCAIDHSHGITIICIYIFLILVFNLPVRVKKPFVNSNGLDSFSSLRVKCRRSFFLILRDYKFTFMCRELSNFCHSFGWKCRD